MSVSIDDLVRSRTLVVVPRDTQSAYRMLEDAMRNKASSIALQGTGDNAGSYALAYDAARKAITAHMTHAGYRVPKNVIGHHVAIERYGLAVFPLHEVAIRAFDVLRRKRN